MSTLSEIKAAAEKLPAAERNELAVWLSEADEVWKIRREELRRAIASGMAQRARGEAVPLDVEEFKREARARMQVRA